MKLATKKGLLGSLLALAASSCSPGNPANSDWAEIGNGPNIQHHSDITAINRDNVDDLDLAWSAEMPTEYGMVGNPLIKNGVVFQSAPGGRIFANSLKDGKQLWEFTASYPEKSADEQSLTAFTSRQANRGLALYGDMAIVATGDCRLVAVDQKSGKQRWEAQSCDPNEQYGITAAPRVGGGMVFTGNNCADSGLTRGFVDAFDAETGKHKWRFYTVPGDPATEKDPFYQKIAKTWGTGWYAKSRGCASAWDAMVYDEKLDQLVFGTGSPSPGNPQDRAADAGDELFTNSVVAVDAKTGKYKWHHKQLPHEAWNYEAAVGLMIADIPVNGKVTRTVVSVPKQGFTYVYDAATGKYLSGVKYTEMTWASGLDAEGRPIYLPDARYWDRPGQDTNVLPSPVGAHSWEALAFNPKSSTVFVPATVMPSVLKTDPAAFIGGTLMEFGDHPGSPVKTHAEVVAIDLASGKVKWRTTTTKKPMNGGLLHTAGGLVFQGLADGRLVALDEDTGKIVWSRQTGGSIRGAPSTVTLNGVQYIVVATGNGSSSFATRETREHSSSAETRTPSRLLAFKIGGEAPYPSLAKAEPVPMPSVPRQDERLAATGKALFEGNACIVCHGRHGGASAGGTVPDLNRMPPPSLEIFKQVVQGGALRTRGMPQYKDMSDSDAQAIFAHIINEAWLAHDRTQPGAKPAP
ncbi:PQQ-binding-like beta-propeller repeat protein [Sphingopyxis sp.]|jgi:quinohemoprotein ethanol dehydrogenase|uniref:outer membrane protein assembly factor BamB family protein n=1 Tax=Sphingopyxis sp. TaxID=1908224 RepID=UPI002DF344AE|nr:PQQ-binding-like beta-propeller repeat protein [Sphingopyxis sp.]